MYNFMSESSGYLYSLPEPAKGNILLIDDLPENLKLLTDLLSQIGYVVRSAVSGMRGFKSAKSKPPDIILLDIKMPEMDGYQVCTTFKNDPDLSNIPILFISALDETFDKLKAFQVGGVDYITKPFQIEEVAARIEAHLTIQKQQQVLQNEIAKRQEIEEVLYQSRALLASVLNSALDGIAAMQAVRDPITGDIEDFRCLVVNPIMSKALNYNREDIIGRLVLKKLLQNLDPNLFDQFVNVVETGEPLNQDFYYPSGNSCWYHYVVVKLGDGFAITVRDITKRKQTELDLQKINDQLQEANHKLELLSNLDGLTQIANRRCFNDRIMLEWQRLHRDRQPLSLLMFDVDYFKRYNDFYGHQLGDECLIKIAQTVDNLMRRPADLVARYGGEEFIIILPNTSAEGAIVVADLVHQAIQKLQIPHQDSTVSGIVTISMGIACDFPKLERSPYVLINQADHALYEAKQQGRNRSVLFVE